MNYKSIINSNIVNSWLNGVVLLTSSIIAIPVVISKLEIEQINVWFLLSSMNAIGLMFISGFNKSFSRFITYSYSGVKIKDFEKIYNKKNQPINYSLMDLNEFSLILFTMKRSYLFLSFIYLIITSIISYFFLTTPISQMSNPNDGWHAVIFTVFTGFLNVNLSFFSVFLQSIKKINLLQRASAIVNLIGLVLKLIVLYYSADFLSIVYIYQTVLFSVSFVIYIKAKFQIKSLKLNKVLKFDFKLIEIFWNSLWKNAITVILAGGMKHFSGLLIAQWFVPSVTSSFMFTQKIFDILERFTMLSFISRLPKIAELRSRGQLVKLKNFLTQTFQICFIVFICGYIVFLIGQPFLNFFNFNVEIGSYSLIIIFSFSALISRWSGMLMAVSNQSNNVIEHLNIFIVFLFFVIIVTVGYKDLGILVFPLAYLISVIISSLILMKKVYRGLDTNFFSAEKFVLIPFTLMLLMINLCYYTFL